MENVQLGFQLDYYPNINKHKAVEEENIFMLLGRILLLTAMKH